MLRKEAVTPGALELLKIQRAVPKAKREEGSENIYYHFKIYSIKKKKKSF